MTEDPQSGDLQDLVHVLRKRYMDTSITLYYYIAQLLGILPDNLVFPPSVHPVIGNIQDLHNVHYRSEPCLLNCDLVICAAELRKEVLQGQLLALIVWRTTPRFRRYVDQNGFLFHDGGSHGSRCVLYRLAGV
jgi:hypothetical protein